MAAGGRVGRRSKHGLRRDARSHVLTPCYRIRAEAPGIYKALPATAEAMYAPELRGNSEDLKLEMLK